jgi:hypothetical protein
MNEQWKAKMKGDVTLFLCSNKSGFQSSNAFLRILKETTKESEKKEVKERERERE